MRRMGSTALHLAYVAAGRADATFGMGTNPWDIAAWRPPDPAGGGRFLVPPGNPIAAEQPWLSPGLFRAHARSWISNGPCWARSSGATCSALRRPRRGGGGMGGLSPPVPTVSR